MRFQEGILLDKMKVRIGVTSVSKGAGATFVSQAIDHLLNHIDTPRLFVSRPDKYIVTDSPERPEDVDLLICVLDPLPSKLKEGAPRFAALKNMNVPQLWLINRDNPGVNHRQLERFLEIRPDFSQEALPYESICRAEYNCEKSGEVLKLSGIEKLAEYIRREYR